MSKSQVSGIYVLRNRVNGLQYVGSSVNVQRRWREHRHDFRAGKHPNERLQRVWNKYGEDILEFTVVEVEVPRAELGERETSWIRMLRSSEKPHGYNLSPSGRSMTGFRHTEEAKARMREAALLRPPVSLETRERMGQAKRGRKRDPEAVAKTATANRGRKHGEEFGMKISERVRGRKASPETRQKISDAQRGRKQPVEAVEKRAAANRGKKRSPEARAAISAGSRGKKKPPITEEHRAKLSAASTGRMHTPETRAKISAARRARAALKQSREKV